jgi:hypothetical protein
MRSSLGTLGLAAVLIGAGGCYSLEPIRGSSPTPGTRIALDVNDAGRVALGGSMGPEIDRVEGTLIERSNGEYLLGVTSVSLLRGGGVQTWKGEHVVVKPEFVSNVYERRLDKARTGLFAAAIAGSVIAIASQNLLTNGSEDPGQHQDTVLTNRRPRIKHVTLLSIPLSRLPVIGRP